MKYILALLAILLLAAGCETRECIKSHEETYYSTQGTALFVATKNPGFIAQNGYKTRTVCDEYAPTPNP